MDKKKFFCTHCPIGCGRVVELSDGGLGGGLEYETFPIFGPNLFIDDLDAVMAANELANRLGIDTISAGGAIGFLMKVYEGGDSRGRPPGNRFALGRRPDPACHHRPDREQGGVGSPLGRRGRPDVENNWFTRIRHPCERL